MNTALIDEWDEFEWEFEEDDFYTKPKQEELPDELTDEEIEELRKKFNKQEGSE